MSIKPKYKLWDLPVRIAHLLLIVGICTAFATAQFDLMTIHQYNGYTMIWVVLFRLLWGITGSTSARFLSFLRGPAAIIAYIRSWQSPTIKHWAGHNPVGGWAIVLMLGAVLVQAVSGLFSNNEDVLFDGPLNHLISTNTIHRVSQFHHLWFYFVVLTLIVIHISANLAYRFVKQQDLITPMITGMAPIDKAEASALMFAPAWRLAACLFFAALPVLALLFNFI